MTKQADLSRVQADLQAAQAEIETAKMADGSVAESLKFGFKSLLAAVGALFAGFNDHEHKIGEHDRQLKIALEQIADLQKRVHGLKVSRGKAIAARERALTAIDSARGALDRISLH
jgi:chromosome segregation ATPase